MKAHEHKYISGTIGDECGFCGLLQSTIESMNEPVSSEEDRISETAERIVIDYANLSGRDIEHRAEFRERVIKHLKNLLNLSPQIYE